METNNFYKSKFYTAELHYYITEGISYRENKIAFYKEINHAANDINLVVFRVMDPKKPHRITYNNISYPYIYQASILRFLLAKSDFMNSHTYNEFGDYFTILTDGGFKKDSIPYINTSYTVEGNEYLEEYRNTDKYKNTQFTHYYHLFDYMKKNVILYDEEKFYEIIFHLLDKNIYHLFDRTLDVRIDDSFYNLSDVDELYLIKDCVFLVQDLNNVLVSLRKQLCFNGEYYTVDQGPYKSRGNLNSMNTFLTLLDYDYRNFLYNTHISLIGKGDIPMGAMLPRSKYSFKNIHQKTSNIRYYSTFINKKDSSLSSNILTDDSDIMVYNQYKNIGNTIKRSTSYDISKKNNYKNIILSKKFFSTKLNRQDLFEESYNKISLILRNNSYVNSIRVQKEIELLLDNQENIFFDKKPDEKTMNFDEKTYDLLKTRQLELCKLLKNPDRIPNTKVMVESKEISLDILDVLGVKTISTLLLSFFISIFSKEIRISDDKKIPGISTIWCFEDFGKVIFNKYLYKLYKKYKKDNEIIDISFSIYKDSIKYKYINSIKDLHILLEKKKTKIDKDLKIENFDDIADLQDNIYYATIGSYYIDKLIVSSMIYTENVRNSHNYKQTIQTLKVSDNIRKELVKYKHKNLPQNLPMICPPKDYIYSKNSYNNVLGGYLLNDETRTDTLIRNKERLKQKSVIKKKNIIVSMANRFMKIPYKVNKDTLNFIYEYGHEKDILINCDSKIMEDFIANPYHEKYKDSLNEKMSLYSKIVLQKNILSIAETYSNMEKIYFPVTLDFRGRIYASTDYFDYQKNDLAKGLISFVNPGYISRTDIEAINYFKAFGANMYANGLDKKSRNYKVKWIDDNMDRLLNFESNDIVNNSESKACFISFCFEYKRFINFINSIDQVVFKTYLPIQLDASCNGYQHLALLTQDTKVFKKLNLGKSTYNDEPDDFYNYLNSIVSKQIDINIESIKKKEILSDDDLIILKIFKKLKSLNLERSILKKVIMKESYNASIPTLIDDIIEHENIKQHGKGKDTYYTYLNNDIKLYKKDFAIYIKTLKESRSIIAPKIDNLSKYLKQIAEICTTIGMAIPWRLPSGLYIYQSYKKQERLSLSFKYTKTRYTIKNNILDKYSLSKQKDAIRPNLIHSLDGTTIALLCESLPENIDMYTVHDCFAVTADNIPILISKLKLVYMKLYSDNTYLTMFDSILRININNTCGEHAFKVDGDTIYWEDKKKKVMRELKFPDIKEVIGVEESLDVLLQSSYIIH